MDTDRQSRPDSNHFGPATWMEMGNMSQQQSPQHSPPLSEYHGLSYVPLDPSYGMSIPPPYSSLPLTVPSHQWPSVIATQSHFPHDSGLPHVPLPGLSQVAPINGGRKGSIGGANPRRTLTDEDRRQMCLYHEEHKTAKQTDIGALFGVERSTVSKVLRQKEKYLNADDGSRSPIKRAKGRVPDIEKALSNWARNYQKQGFPLSDAMIKEKAHFFASTCGGPDGKDKVLTPRWLEKFKHKYNLVGAKSRRGSYDTNKSGSNSPTRLSINSGLASTLNSPTLLSPTSPSGFGSPSPLSPSQSHENIKNGLAEGLANLAGDYHQQQQQPQQQQQQQQQQKETNSSDATGSSSLSADITSPTSTLVSESGPFSPTSQSHFTPPDINHNNTRNQMFPFGTVDPNMISEEQQRQQQQQQQQQQPQQQQQHIIDQPQAAPSKNAIQDSLSLAILEPPFDMENASTDISNTIKRNRSNPEIKAKPIYPSSYSKSTTVSPISPPCSPTQDEARRALELVMNYFQHQPTGLCAQEYVTIGKLMERLDLAKNQSNMLPGGLTRINEHDVPSHMNRKGSIQSLQGLV